MFKFAKHLPSVLSITSGALISWVLSHPSSPAKKKIPQKSAKNIYFIPNLKVHRKTHYYHFHHWMYLGFIYVPLVIYNGEFKGKKVVEGFILGSILHGLSYGDRFKIKFTPEFTSI